MFVQDNIDPKNDSQPEDPTKKNQNQTKPNLETAPILENDQPGNQKPVKAHTDIHNSLSNTSLSQKIILALKRKNHTEALKRLQQLCKLTMALT